MKRIMKKALRSVDSLLWVLLLVSAFLPAPMYAGNDVMGEIQFEGKSHVEKTSGVWVDGAYVGYLKELKGSKKVLLLPGEHVIAVRQDGYQDFTQKILVQPGQKEVVRVAMEKAPTGPLPGGTLSQLRHKCCRTAVCSSCRSPTPRALKYDQSSKRKRNIL
jgi:hypothetical protein